MNQCKDFNLNHHLTDSQKGRRDVGDCNYAHKTLFFFCTYPQKDNCPTKLLTLLIKVNTWRCDICSNKENLMISKSFKLSDYKC